MQPAPASFLEDFHRALTASIAKADAAHAARAATELAARPLAAHVRAIASHFGVPQPYVRVAIANEIGRCRTREADARDAIARRLS